MAEILIITDDERLRRLLFLLCTEAGHTVGTHAPSLVIAEKGEIPLRYAHLPKLLIGEGGIPRPFSHADIKKEIEVLLSSDASPLFSPTEERLYRALKEASPNYVSREELMLRVFDEEADTGKLNLYVHYLRKKIETDGKKRIFARRGKGYALIC